MLAITSVERSDGQRSRMHSGQSARDATWLMCTVAVLFLAPLAPISAQGAPGLQPLAIPVDQPLLCRLNLSNSKDGLQFRIGNKLSPERVIDIDFDSTGSPAKLSESALVWFGHDSLVVHGYVVVFAGRPAEGGLHFRSTRDLSSGDPVSGAHADSIRRSAPRSLEKMSPSEFDRALQLANWLSDHRCRK